jgi:Zn-dependent peptidase ImmA (M78 family)
MNWPEAHQQAMFAAYEAHEDLGLDTFRRIDVFQAMHEAGLKLIFRQLDCAALYLPPVLGSRPGAIINSDHPLVLERYSAGHEFGHHVFEHGPQVDRETALRLSGTRLPPHEMVAEAFAAWFLMPPEIADVALEQIGCAVLEEPADVYAFALRLGVSYSAACVHLPSLKFVSRARSDAWGKIAPKTIKQALSATPPPGGWQNDVWVLSERDAGATLVVRAGDRLLVSPAGEWAVRELPGGAVLAEDEPRDLFEAASPTRPLVIDLPKEVDGGPATLVLERAGQAVTFALQIERPRLGLYVPARGVANKAHS